MIASEPSFSPRQLEIMRHWAQTPSAQAVAKRMNLSVHTIHTQMQRMRVKIGAKRTVEVLLYLQGR